VTYSRLLSAEEGATAAELLAEVRPRERAGEDRPFVFVNMVATIDGRAQLGGSTGELGEDADLEMLLELRAIADAVLIGSGTLRVEGYARLIGSEERRGHREAAGLAADPLAVLLSRGLDLPWDAGLFAAPEQPVLIYTAEDGGPTLNSALLGAGLVDELFLTIAPQITGEAEALRIVEGDGLAAPLRARPVWVLRARGELFLRYALS